MTDFLGEKIPTSVKKVEAGGENGKFDNTSTNPPWVHTKG